MGDFDIINGSNKIIICDLAKEVGSKGRIYRQDRFGRDIVYKYVLNIQVKPETTIQVILNKDEVWSLVNNNKLLILSLRMDKNNIFKDRTYYVNSSKDRIDKIKYNIINTLNLNEKYILKNDNSTKSIIVYMENIEVAQINVIETSANDRYLARISTIKNNEYDVFFDVNFGDCKYVYISGYTYDKIESCINNMVR